MMNTPVTNKNTSNKRRKTYPVFIMIKSAVRFFYPKTKVEGFENIPDEPCIIVGNHSQLHGPITSELFFPDDFYTWCASQMMELRQVPEYAYEDFWSRKPKLLRPFYKLLSYVIAPLSAVIFKNARTVAVYKDKRILNTFRESVSKLQNGKTLVIFPEYDKPYNNILWDFQEGFVDVAKLHFKRTGKELCFVPLYIAPNLKKMCLGKPIRFSSDADIAEERGRICKYLMSEISNIAYSLPRHTVIPYRNIPKKQYPENIEY